PRGGGRGGGGRPTTPLQPCEVRAAAEPVAQPLGLLCPHATEAWPQRLDQFHLVAVLHHPLTQFVPFGGARLRPVGRDQAAGGAVAGGEAGGERLEIEAIERPSL